MNITAKKLPIFGIIFFIFSIVDTIITKLVSNKYELNVMSEYNFMANYFVNDLFLYILIKLSVFAAVMFLIIWCYIEHKHVAIVGMLVIIALYISIIVNNAILLL